MARTTTVYEFTFAFDGEQTFSDAMASVITDKILCKLDEKTISKEDESDYNTDKVSVQHVSGLCDKAS